MTVENHDAGERALWLAVIERAFFDLLDRIESHGSGDNNRAHMERLRRRAREWLLRGGRDFREVCALAGVEPEAVRELADVLCEAIDAGYVSPMLGARFDLHMSVDDEVATARAFLARPIQLSPVNIAEAEAA